MNKVWSWSQLLTISVLLFLFFLVSGSGATPGKSKVECLKIKIGKHLESLGRIAQSNVVNGNTLCISSSRSMCTSEYVDISCQECSILRKEPAWNWDGRMGKNW